MKEISREDYLTALGLFHIANKHQRKCDEAESQLNELLGLENGSHVSDEIYTYGGANNLDDALKREGIKVASPKADTK